MRHTSRARASEKTTYVLFNPLSSEKWELGDVSDEALSETVRALRELRLMRSVRCDDDEFVETSLSLGLGRYEALEGLVGQAPQVLLLAAVGGDPLRVDACALEFSGGHAQIGPLARGDHHPSARLAQCVGHLQTQAA